MTTAVCITAAGEFVEKNVTVKSPDKITCNRQMFPRLLTVVDRLHPDEGLCVFGKIAPVRGGDILGTGQFPAPLDVPLYWGPHIFLMATGRASPSVAAGIDEGGEKSPHRSPEALSRQKLVPMWETLVEHSAEHQAEGGGAQRRRRFLGGWRWISLSSGKSMQRSLTHLREPPSVPLERTPG